MQGIQGRMMKQLPFMVIICMVMLLVVYRTTNYQYQQAEIESRLYPFYSFKDFGVDSKRLNGLPRGIIQARSDLELKPLWSPRSSREKVDESRSHNLLAMPVGVKQKRNVNIVAQKFLAENFTIMLFHYDGRVNEWSDLPWSREAIHIAVNNQTKWWFAKRFLHPSVVSVYDYIFLWDEDLGVEKFHPGRYLKIVKSEGLEISQPALDPSNSTDIHHKITIRRKKNKFHRRVWEARGGTNCSEASEGPPCTGFVEGMAPVFSKSAWQCAWHLIQNDLVHGWGMDMKLGYCAQGDRTKKVGIVDSEYVIHLGIPTLGGLSSTSKKNTNTNSNESTKRRAVNGRAEVRRQSTIELQMFKKRWERAAEEDKSWVDPFSKRKRKRRRRSGSLKLTEKL
ncbi:uncharacterized protein LOC124914829 isoform X2 [Impatiens glandulifera]|uniref:uncharacterized protein LOC124914829 isoform X2 n=1 Tax=Impatiens glandulifera TaxID=253017 RepID=UPI001FB07218|nr:uncharacterized protein LOC124914829 isoform X2 [Impatiens glandulifera]